MSIKVKIWVDHDLVHGAPHLLCGLFELESQRLISTTWRLSAKIVDKRSIPVAMRCEVQRNGIATRHCFDFHDDSNCWNYEALDWCDVYWKVNFSAADADALALTQGRKVRKYGFYFPSRSRNDRHVMARFLGHALSRLEYRWTKYRKIDSWECYKILFKRRKDYWRRLFLDEYECSSRQRGIDIYFHPGAWPESISGCENVNTLRRDIIVKLKALFGEKFVGGFSSNEISRKMFPSEVLDGVLTHNDYVTNLKNSKIVISNNGLGGCHSWRTGEAFAAGAIVVSERPKNGVDEFLEDGKNIHFYDTAEECVDICNNILVGGQGKLCSLQNNSVSYYRNYLAPPANALRKIQMT